MAAAACSIMGLRAEPRSFVRWRAAEARSNKCK